MDSLIFTSDSVKGTKVEEPVTAKKNISPVKQSADQDIIKSATENEIEGHVEVENIERPVDLYKVTPYFQPIRSSNFRLIVSCETISFFCPGQSLSFTCL